jgi:hypothetical protein
VFFNERQSGFHIILQKAAKKAARSLCYVVIFEKKILNLLSHTLKMRANKGVYYAQKSLCSLFGLEVKNVK